jgi:hypothetical protein
MVLTKPTEAKARLTKPLDADPRVLPRAAVTGILLGDS